MRGIADAPALTPCQPTCRGGRKAQRCSLGDRRCLRAARVAVRWADVRATPYARLAPDPTRPDPTRPDPPRRDPPRRDPPRRDPPRRDPPRRDPPRRELTRPQCGSASVRTVVGPAFEMTVEPRVSAPAPAHWMGPDSCSASTQPCTLPDTRVCRPANSSRSRFRFPRRFSTRWHARWRIRQRMTTTGLGNLACSGHPDGPPCSCGDSRSSVVLACCRAGSRGRWPLAGCVVVAVTGEGEVGRRRLCKGVTP
ncbi:hypothetical protein BJY18_006437 [Amycolatopsis jiangsuensis]|uniref:Uncharacterized protein n=1 Tax=Amycolatopsis jiangsuensis TaxID=1181879 RepID=A0A840J691_9PSEU|nr:hypothetical protein [Amycolatopsis jiangsuensis]